MVIPEKHVTDQKERRLFCIQTLASGHLNHHLETPSLGLLLYMHTT